MNGWRCKRRLVSTSGEEPHVPVMKNMHRGCCKVVDFHVKCFCWVVIMTNETLHSGITWEQTSWAKVKLPVDGQQCLHIKAR